MTSSGPKGKRARRFARGQAAAVAVGMVSAVICFVAACGDSYGDLCDPSRYLGGTANSGYLASCCDPKLYPNRIVLDPRCPNHNQSPDGGDGGDASADGPIEPPCPGQCLMWPPVGWGLPLMVWIGPEAAAPPCPDTALSEVFHGRIDLDAGDLPCGKCACDAPDGGCILPATLTANAAPCAKITPTTPMTPFDPPAGWDGGCTAHDAIDAGGACGAGTCVQSLTIAPPTVNDTGCAPIQPPLPNDPPAWSFARACMGQAGGACGGGFFCAPPPAPGFHACVPQQGDNDCTGPTYTEKHVAFAGVEDTRSCSPCTCGTPTGSKCTVTITIYPEAACATASTYQATVDSGGPACTDVTKGAALGSKSASAPAYSAGTCEPGGGAPTGAANPTGPTTFCCIPQP